MEGFQDYQLPLTVTFIDFKAAFDSINRKVMFAVLRHYGIPEPLVNTLGALYTGKSCHRGKCHSGNCHSGERWMSRPFVHSGNLNFKHTLTNNLVFHNAWKTCHLSLYNIKKDMLLTGPFAMLSMPSFDFHCHCVRKASSSTSPHYGNCHFGNFHCFPRWHNFPVYNNSKSAVMVDGNISDPFEAYTGVLQGDVLAPFLFIILLCVPDWSY